MGKLLQSDQNISKSANDAPQPHRVAWAYALIGSAVFLASVFGIATRPIEQLALFWPANGVLLALFILMPRVANVCGTVIALAAYLAADVLYGTPLIHAIWLTGSNLASVVAGYGCFALLSRRTPLRAHPAFILFLLGICTVAGLAAALIGAFAGHYVLGEAVLHTLGFWFATELLNYLIVVPLIINLCSLRDTALLPVRYWHTVTPLPLVALAFAHLACFAFPGPGIIGYPMAALVWCAITYDQRYTAVLSTLSTCWLAIAIPNEWLSIGGPVVLMNEAASFRLGLAQMLVVPLVVSSLSHAWSQMHEQLLYAVSHDTLTGVLSRGELLRAGGKMVEGHRHDDRHPAALMIDIDHFKSVNDSYGHAIGDQVIVHVAQTLASHLRQGDILGRLGGEEFAIILSNASHRDALAVAERVLIAVREAKLERGDEDAIGCTVSIGVGVSVMPLQSVEELLILADGALYEAKRLGRDRVECAVQGR